MIASKLKDPIKILEQVISTTDFGETRYSYQDKYDTRACINYVKGKRIVDDDEIFYSVNRDFIVRSYVPICDTDIIEWDNNRWQVLSIDRDHKYNNIVVHTTKINL